MIEREKARMAEEAKEGGEVRDDYVARLRDLDPGSAPWQKRCDLVAERLGRAAAAAFTAVVAAVMAAPAALAQAQGGGGGFDPQGMVRGFGEDIGWIILLLVLVGLAKAVWDRNVVTGVVVILVGGFFATLAMGPDAILDAGSYITGRAGLGGGGQ